MANVIERLQKLALVIAHNKTLAAQLYGEFKEFFRRMRWSILCPSITKIIPAQDIDLIRSKLSIYSDSIDYVNSMNRVCQ